MVPPAFHQYTGKAWKGNVQISSTIFKNIEQELIFDFKRINQAFGNTRIDVTDYG